MLTIEQLEKAGYKRYSDNTKRTQNCVNDPYKGTWQKRFDDERGKKYFINIAMWNFWDSDFKNSYMGDNGPDFQAYTQFNGDNDFTFNVELLHNAGRDLKAIEMWFEKMWVEIGDSNYYEFWGE